MQRPIKFLAACLAMGIAGNAAMAQNNPAKLGGGAEVDYQKRGQDHKQAQQRSPQAGYLAHASKVLDMTLRDPQGKEIGEVEDLVIDSQGRVALVIVSFENDFVAGDKLYAVPPQALRPGSDPARQDLILTTTKDKFAATNGFTKDQYPKFDEQSTRETYRRFDQTPYWEGRMEDRDRDQLGRTGPRSQNQQSKPDRDTDARDDRTSSPLVTEDAPRDNLTPAQRAAQDANRDNLTPAQRAAWDANRDRANGANGYKSDEDRRREYSQAPRFDGQHGWTCRASEIIGKKVVNSSDEGLGSIKDLLVDDRQHRVVYAVLSNGGVLGIGRTLTPIPYSALKAAGDKDHFALDATKDSFETFSFTEGAWPDLTNRQWAQRVHTQFNQDPYWAGYGDAGTDDVDQHWRRDSTYNKGYDAQRSTTVKGTVTSVSEFSPQSGAAKGRQIMLKGDDGKTYTVHTGPTSYMQRQDSTFAIAQGDQVTVTGSTCKFQDKDVLIASQIRNKDGQTLELRDNTGRPRWDTQDRDNRPDNRNQDDDLDTISDRRTDRSAPDSGIQSSPNQSKP